MHYLGCHLSIAGGYLQMGKTAQEIGANTFAFFTRNPRGRAAPRADEGDLHALSRYLQENGFGPLVAHAPYTLNLCSDKEEVRINAENTMAEDLAILENLPGCLYNFHPGCHMRQGRDKGIEMIAEAINRLLRHGNVCVLLETMAGKGTEIGGRFEDLADILSLVENQGRMGICLDTCHVSDGGYPIASDPQRVIEEFDRVIGLSYLKALHLNDSKNPCGSRKDRHEKLGQGYLGLSMFENLLKMDCLRTLPMILETPNELSGYAEEIRLLREFDRC